MYMAVALLVWVAWIINPPRPPKGEGLKHKKVSLFNEAHFFYYQ